MGTLDLFTGGPIGTYQLDNSWELCGLARNSPGELAAVSQSWLHRLLPRRLPPGAGETAAAAGEPVRGGVRGGAVSSLPH